MPKCMHKTSAQISPIYVSHVERNISSLSQPLGSPYLVIRNHLGMLCNAIHFNPEFLQIEHLDKLRQAQGTSEIINHNYLTLLHTTAFQLNLKQPKHLTHHTEVNSTNSTSTNSISSGCGGCSHTQHIN